MDSAASDLVKAVPVELRLLFAGGMSGALTYTIVSPLERAKILLQVQGMRGGHKYGGVFSTIATIVREEGALALWKGNMANVARVVPAYSLKFMFNDRFNDLVRRPGQLRTQMSFGQDLAAGTLAGMFQMIITYPLETVKTRMTLSRELAGGASYLGVLDCFRTTVRVEGVGALYKGFGVAVISGAPYVGLQMSCYKLIQSVLPKKSNGDSSWLIKISSGAVAGLIAQSLMYPVRELFFCSFFSFSHTFFFVLGRFFASPHADEWNWRREANL